MGDGVHWNHSQVAILCHMWETFMLIVYQLFLEPLSLSVPCRTNCPYAGIITIASKHTPLVFLLFRWVINICASTLCLMLYLCLCLSGYSFISLNFNVDSELYTLILHFVLGVLCLLLKNIVLLFKYLKLLV